MKRKIKKLPVANFLNVELIDLTYGKTFKLKTDEYDEILSVILVEDDIEITVDETRSISTLDPYEIRSDDVGVRIRITSKEDECVHMRIRGIQYNLKIASTQ